MSNIIPFNAPSRHSTGPAICRGCRHEWVAVTETDGLELECPNCATMKGTFKWAYAASEGQYTFVCGCGCEDFFILSRTEKGDASVYCRNCGDEKVDWWCK